MIGRYDPRQIPTRNRVGIRRGWCRSPLPMLGCVGSRPRWQDLVTWLVYFNGDGRATSTAAAICMEAAPFVITKHNSEDPALRSTKVSCFILVHHARLGQTAECRCTRLTNDQAGKKGSHEFACRFTNWHLEWTCFKWQSGKPPFRAKKRSCPYSKKNKAKLLASMSIRPMVLVNIAHLRECVGIGHTLDLMWVPRTPVRC